MGDKNKSIEQNVSLTCRGVFNIFNLLSVLQVVLFRPHL